MKTSTTPIRTTSSKFGFKTLILTVAFATLLTTFTSCTADEINTNDRTLVADAPQSIDPLPLLKPTTPTTPPKQ